MPDIDLCAEELCLKKDSCERFLIFSKSAFGVSYFVPDFDHDGKPFDGCEFYREQTNPNPKNL